MIGFFKSVREDVAAVFENDPAARSYLEVLFCYPGLHAVWMHHATRWLWRHHFRFLARFGSQVARILTGIEIHPGAEIGRRLFIDHGMGTVIGETSIVGDDVTLYQGVTLGDNCRIGAGSVVLRNVPPNSTIVGVPGHVVLRDGKRVVITDPKEIRDPLSDVIVNLAKEIQELRERLQRHTRTTEPGLPLDEEESAKPRVAPEELFAEDYQDYQI
jgi:serine O-acetyltransferase